MVKITKLKYTNLHPSALVMFLLPIWNQWVLVGHQTFSRKRTFLLAAWHKRVQSNSLKTLLMLTSCSTFVWLKKTLNSRSVNYEFKNNWWKAPIAQRLLWDLTKNHFDTPSTHSISEQCRRNKIENKNLIKNSISARMMKC